jgi:hypothetical protein
MSAPRQHHISMARGALPCQHYEPCQGVPLAEWREARHHVSTMSAPCQHHVSTMSAPCQHHVSTMSARLRVRAIEKKIKFLFATSLQSGIEN